MRPLHLTSAGPAAPDVNVVVVSYNVRDLLANCLASLECGASGLPLDVVVVDNGSSDGSVELVRQRFPHVRIIASTTNLGYGGAINRAARSVRGRFLLLLNPDTEMTEGAIKHLVDVLDSKVDAAVAGPRLRYPNGAAQSSRRRFPGPLTAVVESTVLQRYWPDAPVLSRYYVADRPDVRQDVDWLVGACLLVRRSVFEAVGGFDERFSMYSEELDLCHRIRDSGYQVCFEPAAEVIHHEGRSSEQNLVRRSRQFAESKALYFEKYFGKSVAIAVRIALVANTVYELAEEFAKLLVRHRPELRRQRIRDHLAVASDQISGLMRTCAALTHPGFAAVGVVPLSREDFEETNIP
ncbi:MAG TPA: glycosyltransferase family 2 protein [Chloroflexota bacterium]|nr:glycosyltransferase family 2 protein [Chloroflexota bacterium]